MEKIIVENEKSVINRLTEEISKCAKSSLAERAVFRVGLSGGSVLNYLCEAIPNIQSDLSKWRFFFCDERFVDESDKESTFGGYKINLIPKTTFTVDQFARINTKIPLEECAKDYEAKILKEFNVEKGNIPQFDLLLLGMGPDGHTCSLFPGHNLLSVTDRLVAPITDSPKPPTQRITMTFPLINNARFCIFAMCGEGKAEIVKRVFVDKETLPAAMVRLVHGNVLCIFDKSAAKYL